MANIYDAAMDALAGTVKCEVCCKEVKPSLVYHDIDPHLGTGKPNQIGCTMCHKCYDKLVNIVERYSSLK